MALSPGAIYLLIWGGGVFVSLSVYLAESFGGLYACGRLVSFPSYSLQVSSNPRTLWALNTYLLTPVPFMLLGSAEFKYSVLMSSYSTLINNHSECRVAVIVIEETWTGKGDLGSRFQLCCQLTETLGELLFGPQFS